MARSRAIPARRTASWRWALALALLLSIIPAKTQTAAAAGTVANTYLNTASIAIPGSAAVGAANPYPSPITVSGACGRIVKVTLTLVGLSHTFPSDLDMLLVAPNGAKLIVLSDVGQGFSRSNLNIVLDDDAATSLPGAAALSSGTFKPTNNEAGDVFASPAPGGPYSATTFAAAFNGADPNGTWRLFIQDDESPSTGSLSGGWKLTITTACFTLTTPVEGSGYTTRNPAGEGAFGTFVYPPNTSVILSAFPYAGNTFVGWSVNGTFTGWSPAQGVYMDADQEVRATFKPTATFTDVPAGRADAGAIVALATRGFILGYGDGRYGPDDGVQRAQMAALIARAMPAGPGTPPVALTPPACAIANTWDCEDWGTHFQDRNGLDGNLWRDVETLYHYAVAFGYTAADCAAKGLPYPCYAPTAPVTYAETVVFITRAMIAKGYWLPQPGGPQPYAGVPGVFATEIATYHYYTQGAGGVPAPPADWNAGATRGWFARALWQALDSFWGNTLP